MTGAGRPRSAIGASRSPRVIVMRPDHLGDLLLTLPAIAAFRHRLPGAHIALMVPPALLPIAARATDVDEALPMPLELGDPLPGAGSPAVVEAAERLRGRFDVALLPRPADPWSGSLATAAGVPLRVGHTQPRTLPFLTHAFPERPSRHVAREAVVLALRAVQVVGGAPPGHHGSRGPLLRLLPDDERLAADVLTRLVTDEARVAVVHPTSGWPLKTWPLERWVAVVRELGDRLGAPILVVGQPRDRQLLEAIADGAGARAHAVHDISVATLAALHARARIVVGIDSGALHLAALHGRPVVGMFGPFHPDRVAPLATRTRIRALWGRLECSPCGTLETPPCGATQQPACLRAISADQLVEAVVGLDTHVRHGG